jgi:hypothetical protein
MVKNGFWNEDQKLGLCFAGPGYSFELVNLIDTHMVMLFFAENRVGQRGYFIFREKVTYCLVLAFHVAFCIHTIQYNNDEIRCLLSV